MKKKIVWAIVIALVTTAALLITGCPQEPATPPPSTEPVTEISPAPIHEVDVLFMESYPVQVAVYIQGGLSDGCTEFHDAVATREGNTINIEATVERPKDAECTQEYRYFEKNVGLGSDFTPGETYTLNVNDYTTTFDMP
jgi:hypothetical protein